MALSASTHAAPEEDARAGDDHPRTPRLQSCVILRDFVASTGAVAGPRARRARQESSTRAARIAVWDAGLCQYCDLAQRYEEGRLIADPRLLIRKSLVRAQPGEPTTTKTSETPHGRNRLLR